jgi:hypothetical protein
MTEHRDDGDAGCGRLASELLGAGRTERASQSARERATQALLVGITAPSAAAANAGSWTAGLKWLGISVMLGVGGGLWRMAVHRPDEGEGLAHVRHPPAPATQHEVVADNARGARHSATTSSAAPLPSAPSPRAAVPRAVAAPLATPTAAAVRGATDPRLAQELLALNRARAAVAGGSPEQALSTLDGVAGGFRVLPLEASLVRVEALRGAGKRDSARALCEQLLRAHPDGPYTERLRSLATALGSIGP